MRPGQHFLRATAANNRVAGALWLVEEGGLSAELSSQAVWCGFPAARIGNLVARSLAAHGSDPL